MKVIYTILYLLLMILLIALIVAIILVYKEYGGKPIGEIPTWIYIIFFRR